MLPIVQHAMTTQFSSVQLIHLMNEMEVTCVPREDKNAHDLYFIYL